jgi:hypothetical protein
MIRIKACIIWLKGDGRGSFCTAQAIRAAMTKTITAKMRMDMVAPRRLSRGT